MAKDKKCDLKLIKDFIESLEEGTISIGLIDYLISVYGYDELIFMLKQRGDKNGETETEKRL